MSPGPVNMDIAGATGAWNGVDPAGTRAVGNVLFDKLTDVLKEST